MDGYKYAFSDVYSQHFDPGVYLKTYYTNPQGAPHEGDFQSFLTDTNFILSQLLPDNLNKALDFGCGPTVHALMPSVDKFKTAYHAEYLSENRKQVEKWINNSKDAWDFQAFSERFAILKHDRSKTKGIEMKLRAKSGGVMPCDILADKILPNNHDMTFDFIVTSLCLEGVCTRLTDYKIAILKLGKIVNPNGYVLQLAVLNEDQYKVGDVSFPVLPLTLEQAKESWNEAGFTIVDSRDLPNILPDVDIGVCGILVRKL